MQLYDDFDFENMLFTDEKIFTIEEEYNSQNTRMYSKYFAELNDNEKFAFHQLHPEYLMVWAGVSCKGKINLIFLEKEAKMNGKVYETNILNTKVINLTSTMFSNQYWTFFQDSATAHKKKSTQQWLQEHVPNFIQWTEWPASSPDINPMH